MSTLWSADILDSTACLVMLVDVTNAEVVGMNKPTEKLTGYPPLELLDRPLWETILSPEDKPAMRSAYHASVAAGVPLSYECTISTRSGEQRRVLWSGHFLANPYGGPGHLVVTGIDVTANRSTAGLFGPLMRAATTTAFVGTDLGGRVTFFSSGAEQMLGYSAADMIGRVFPLEAFESERFQAHAAALGVPADLSLLNARHSMRDRRGGRDFDLGVNDRRQGDGIPQQRSHSEPRILDWDMVRKDGSRLVAALAIDSVTDPSGRLVGHLVTGHDVTDQRSTEHLLYQTLEMEREAVDRLRKLDQAKSEFVATVSHELRTPMTSIAGFTELLQESAGDVLSTDQLEFVDAIRRNSDRLTALANDLLTLSSLESGTFTQELTDVDLRDVVSAAHDSLQGMIAKRQLDVTIEMPLHPVVVHGDSRNLERMVANLLSNAVKFTEDDGWIRCRLRASDTVATLEVSDDGIGIPAADQADLFTRFFRSSTAVDRAIQGSGLGLTIVASIAHSHGGRIEVVSAPMLGASFTVTLPMG